MECPVCGNEKISPFAIQCSECETDIVAFPLLENLEEESIAILKDKISLEGELVALEQVRRRDKIRYRKSLSRMYWFLFLLPLMFFVCGEKDLVKEDTRKVEAVEVEKQILEIEKQTLQKEKQVLQKKIMELESRDLIIPEEVVHVIEKGDNLFSLAGKYLKDKSKWKRLNALNPEIRDYRKLVPGDTILIKLR